MAHAPGPWLVNELETRTAIKSGKRTVAYVQMARDDYENANLIVAAPEMLAALKLCLPIMAEEYVEHGPKEPERIAIEAAKAAIAKAENAS